jgi:polyhydroxybutyrate depolymerase
MAHRLACRMGDRLAAVVSLAGAGATAEKACAPATSLAVLEVHGDADPIVRYQGGRVFDDGALEAHPSAPDTIRAWANRLGCPARVRPSVTTIDLDPHLPGAETTAERYGPCPRGSAELWTVHGGGHHVAGPEIMDGVRQFLVRHPKPRP